MSKRLSPKVAHSLTEFCPLDSASEQSSVDRVCEMASIIFLHNKRRFSRKYYRLYIKQTNLTKGQIFSFILGEK